MISRSAIGVACACVLAATASLGADTISTRDGASLRGPAVSLDGRGALVRARFEDGERQILVPRETLVGIEFNALTSNAAGVSVLGAPTATGVRREGAAASQTDDVIVLRTGERRSCPPIEIDARRVRCGVDDVALGDVTRLIVGRIR